MFYFHVFFDEVRNRQIVASIYMLNDARYTVADPRNTISVQRLHSTKEKACEALYSIGSSKHLD